MIKIKLEKPTYETSIQEMIDTGWTGIKSFQELESLAYKSVVYENYIKAAIQNINNNFEDNLWLINKILSFMLLKEVVEELHINNYTKRNSPYVELISKISDFFELDFENQNQEVLSCVAISLLKGNHYKEFDVFFKYVKNKDMQSYPVTAKELLEKKNIDAFLFMLSKFENVTFNNSILLRMAFRIENSDLIKEMVQKYNFDPYGTSKTEEMVDLYAFSVLRKRGSDLRMLINSSKNKLDNKKLYFIGQGNYSQSFIKVKEGRTLIEMVDYFMTERNYKELNAILKNNNEISINEANIILNVILDKKDHLKKEDLLANFMDSHGYNTVRREEVLFYEFCDRFFVQLYNDKFEECELNLKSINLILDKSEKVYHKSADESMGFYVFNRILNLGENLSVEKKDWVYALLDVMKKHAPDAFKKPNSHNDTLGELVYFKMQKTKNKDYKDFWNSIQKRYDIKRSNGVKMLLRYVASWPTDNKENYIELKKEEKIISAEEIEKEVVKDSSGKLENLLSDRFVKESDEIKIVINEIVEEKNRVEEINQKFKNVITNDTGMITVKYSVLEMVENRLESFINIAKMEEEMAKINNEKVDLLNATNNCMEDLNKILRSINKIKNNLIDDIKRSNRREELIQKEILNATFSELDESNEELVELIQSNKEKMESLEGLGELNQREQVSRKLKVG